LGYDWEHRVFGVVGGGAGAAQYAGLATMSDLQDLKGSLAHDRGLALVGAACVLLWTCVMGWIWPDAVVWIGAGVLGVLCASYASGWFMPGRS
jgi:phosphotransferase system  glucose/maltose/N-acetylglucosamine-specific IIC component